MKGLDTSISLKGDKSSKILKKIEAQIKEWNLTLPNVDPLVLDFGLGDFDDIGETEFWIANELQGGYCGKYMFLFEGQTCPKHYHDEKLETFFIQKGTVKMEYAGKDFVMKQGDVLLIDLREYHRFSALENSLILEISSPCIGDDNFFENKAIPFGKNH